MSLVYVICVTVFVYFIATIKQYLCWRHNRYAQYSDRNTHTHIHTHVHTHNTDAPRQTNTEHILSSLRSSIHNISYSTDELYTRTTYKNSNASTTHNKNPHIHIYKICM
eukprot:GHVQ01002099.1.p1 GENE.GHVQ01002099.1~~GHVQ01002099.1.p1  ORF type:complete len:109 (-),score=15.20 GHVQ01002099.1:18-344(-)